MEQGRDALAAKTNEAATEALNKLLLLPPNDYTQDGQEWIGVARDRSGQDDKAKVEYDLYLRMYPDGPGAARVAQRMTGLSRSESQTDVRSPGKEKTGAHHHGIRQHFLPLLFWPEQDRYDQYLQRHDANRFASLY